MDFFNKFKARKEKLRSYLCIGLDPEFDKLPNSIQNSEYPLYNFCKEIIDSTWEFAVAYKPNIAFFERFGSKGIYQFEKLILHLTSNYPQIPIVADCKRGDLANTSKEYSKYYFSELKVDSITLSAYMGEDSLEPFLEYKNHSIFLLCLTSNKSSSDLQRIGSNQNKYIYEHVAGFASNLNSRFQNQVGIVVGATHPLELKELRKNYPSLVFLIPGYGAQGGKLDEILSSSGENSLINSSRSIIFASNSNDFAEKAYLKAKEIDLEMKKFYN